MLKGGRLQRVVEDAHGAAEDVDVFDGVLQIEAVLAVPTASAAVKPSAETDLVTTSGSANAHRHDRPTFLHTIVHSRATRPS